MKIAFVSQSYPPIISGAAIVVQRLAEGIAARDHKVMVVAASDCRKAYVKDSENINIHYFPSLKNPLRVDQRFILGHHKELERVLLDFKPDVIHLHDPLNLGLSAVRIAQKHQIPVVITIHQLPWFISSSLNTTDYVKRIIENGLWQYSMWFMAQCSISLTPSKMIADIISENTQFCPEVISNGVEIDLFTPSSKTPNEKKALCEKYKINPDQAAILYVGRIDKDKRVDLVVEAVSQVIKEIDAQLIVVGDGTMRGEIISLCQSLDIYDRCIFPGFVPKNGDLPGIFRLADVFVTASEIEIQSSVVLEAMASGKPVVVVESSSMPEFVYEAQNGYLVKPGDFEAIAKKIICILQDPKRAEAMGKAGREIAEFHSNQKFISSHEQLYASIIRSGVR